MNTGSDYARVEGAIRFLEAQVRERPALSAVAAHAGLSAFHFQRLFRRFAGVSPKSFLQALTLARAKALLADSRSLLDASLELGLSGTGRLHDLFLGLEAMTPGTWKRGGEGLEIAWAVHDTPFGAALFAATPRGLCALAFVAEDAPPLAELEARWPGARFREDPAATAPFAREVAARMGGAPGRPLALVLQGTPFQRKVWEALLAVPEGRLVSYGDLARMAGTPGASRAVGTALGANPIGYLIPCHRVIRASGALGDYRWGAARKRALLGLETLRHAPAPRP
jgi:AraC family transcriptional regulator, regulatory protein of adaptative response / methylated-DNA-[protein]-cysteine methyltransferase